MRYICIYTYELCTYIHIYCTCGYYDMVILHFFKIIVGQLPLTSTILSDQRRSVVIVATRDRRCPGLRSIPASCASLRWCHSYGKSSCDFFLQGVSISQVQKPCFFSILLLRCSLTVSYSKCKVKNILSANFHILRYYF